MSSYLKIVEKAKQKEKQKEKAEEVRATRLAAPDKPPTTNTTNTTKASDTPPLREKPRHDKKPPNFTPLTVPEALAEINRWGSGAGKNAELYRGGELSEEKAVEYVTCAILHHRGEPFGAWRHHSPAVRKALSLCIHELAPDECKVCNGYVKRLIEGGRA